MHFLRKAEVPHWPHTFGKPRAAVTVRVEEQGARLVVQVPEDGPGISVAKADVQWAPLPARCMVVGPGGEEVKPSKGRRFYVTTETFDPCHLVAESE